MRAQIASTVLLMTIAATPFQQLDVALSAESGLITRQSNYSVRETAQRFEDAIKSKGWVFFSEIDHAAAAKQVGLDLKPRILIIFGYPKGGTGPMQKAPTLAIDNPPKALVWQDDQDKVWLTYNSAEYHLTYIYPRHGLTASPEAVKLYEQFLAEISRQATE